MESISDFLKDKGFTLALKQNYFVLRKVFEGTI